MPAFGCVPVEFLYYTISHRLILRVARTHAESLAAPQKKKKQNSLLMAATSGGEPLWLHLFLVAIHIWRDYRNSIVELFSAPCSASYLFVALYVPCFIYLAGWGFLARLWSITVQRRAAWIFAQILFHCTNRRHVSILYVVMCRALFLHHSGYFVLFTFRVTQRWYLERRMRISVLKSDDKSSWASGRNLFDFVPSLLEWLNEMPRV